eukprot:gb/GEZN01022475.1/.p1 GENE.gb/GEZN01022475.1/~~gb/GEZN01022475.1/.p1  ORF type:complete len:147 (+),score=24.50 gb/GEZN01022475.1/:59-499(+)
MQPPSQKPPTFWENLLYFFCLPMVVLLHVVFLWLNHEDVTLHYGLFVTKLGFHFVMFNCFLYGGLIVAGALLWQQQQSFQEIEALKKEKRVLEGNIKNLMAQNAKYQDVTSKILVPYPLDKLVDKDLRDFAAANSVPGALHANLKS